MNKNLVEEFAIEELEDRVEFGLCGGAPGCDGPGGCDVPCDVTNTCGDDMQE